MRYRFGPLQEREQKRQYANANGTLNNGLQWTYTLLGADAKQLMTYNGLQADWCGQPAGTVWIWPVEHNSYGPAQSRIIMRPDGTRNVVITDHLGSTRLTLSTDAAPMQSQLHNAFGEVTSDVGEGARTGYIGREHDVESDLGFYGVRLYEPEYGRFMSTDPLWGMYITLQPYQCAGNNPVLYYDKNGDYITAHSAEAQEFVKSSFMDQFGFEPTFDDLGAMVLTNEQVESVKKTGSQEAIKLIESIADLVNDNTRVVDIIVVDNATATIQVGTSNDTRSEPTWPRLTGEYTLKKGIDEHFLEDLENSVSATILIRPQLVAEQQYTAGASYTAACGSCVLMHALTDHATSWQKRGASMVREDNVDSHNNALRNKGHSKFRDGRDHKPTADPKR